MDINHVLTAHGVMGVGNSKTLVEDVANFSATSSTNGLKINLAWTNPTFAELTKVQVFTSSSDLTNVSHKDCLINASLIVDAKATAYEHISSVGNSYHFKAFAVYNSFGEEIVSSGKSVSALAKDTEPPNPITNFVAKEGNGSVTLNWTNPTNPDFFKTKILYKTTGYPTSPTDGTVVYEGSAITTSVDGLTNETLHYFRAFTYDTSGNINESTTAMQIQATPSSVKIYGVKIDTTNSNPSTAVAYTDDAVGMTGGSTSWDTIYPFNEIRPIMFKNGIVNYELNKTDFTKKKDNTPADITTGTDGDVMIEFPKIWWKFETVGSNLHVRYATKQVDSTWKCLAHTKGVTEKDKVYIGAYLGCETGAKLRSLSGKAPTVSKTIGAFRAVAEANGVGYQQIGYFQLLMLQVLYLIRYKSLDSQTSLGRGYVDANASATNTGGTNTKGMYYGETTGKQQNKFSGIEDFWGNCYYWIDGLFSNASWNILIGTQNFSDTGSGYTHYGQGTTANIGGYINGVQGGTESGFIIKNTTGSATTYYSDYGYLSASSLPFFGGAWANTSNAGAFQLNVVHSAAASYSTVAARLCFV